MARTDNDTWDLTTSVGATATAVAALRAVASRNPRPLINDPFAEPLVRAVGVDFFTRLVSGELDADDTDDESVLDTWRIADMMAVRTRFFDEFFADATKAGIRQAVILASGLDTRAYRLSWPTATTVYEIDQPHVMSFKTNALAELGATPTARRRVLAIDLRQDWPTALQRAGLDATQPTAWSAEGLLGFLPPDAQDRLLDNITALSAVGSRLATDNALNTGQVWTALQAQWQTITDWREQRLDVDANDLLYPGDRHDVAAYLDANGWESAGVNLAELFVANGLSPLKDNEDEAPLASLIYLSATRKLDPLRVRESGARAAIMRPERSRVRANSDRASLAISLTPAQLFPNDSRPVCPGGIISRCSW